ncbi:MAG: DUF2442 domain-containing protein [Oscillospiraceae bacterium]|nr:DUF2442 domain-containing protein [Oscillospiraceae bacterium]
MQIPNEVAEYFQNGRRKIMSVFANDNFTLSLIFDNNEMRIYDMKDNLNGDVFKPFRILSEFKRVFVDENGGVAWDINPTIDSNVVWNNRVDLCPDSCYLKSFPVYFHNNV